MKDQKYTLHIDSPIGILRLESTGDAITAIHFIGTEDQPESDLNSVVPVLTVAKEQLIEYFNGERKSFDLTIAPRGTDFEKEVWNELLSIPYGISITYSKLAEKLGDTNKVRAVGRANGRNPLPVIIPCHRVIGSNNKLTGYAGGVERKKWLLRHEGALLL